MSKTSLPRDLYSVLEISPNASIEVINASYTALKEKTNDPKFLQTLEDTYKILSDETDRDKYNKERFSLDEKKIVGSFRIISKIAEGGYGKTYLGEHILSGMPVCIKHCKKLDAQYQQIMIEEWNAVCNLAHYELPGMRDLVKLPDGTLALVMAYIPGLTLAQLVEKHGRLDPEDVAWIAERILNACRYIHHHGVIHGDIKPQNIIIREENHTIALIDFGLALVKPSAATRSKGHTDYYAPPEQMQGLVLVPESDLYSLGMTMIFALTGKIKCVENRELPVDTPKPLREFIKRLVRQDVTVRPKWDDENLCASIQKVRMEAFGRVESRMKPIGKPDPKA